MEWKDIWKEEPPRNKEIFFITGDEEIHIGYINSNEKLRKSNFYSYHKDCDFSCDSTTSFEERVIYWFPIPDQPERSKREDSIPEWGAKAPLNYDKWEKKCAVRNSIKESKKS